ncbi:hypothetical protein HAX54_047047 [Datura stramonium]|uniref:Uncharacterized protein n=1 Tax=Datura stramonium TaxID=4076 RepID=A0ABS8STR0_DATST|nr:hypothetical protein [Datura stramonium]
MWQDSIGGPSRYGTTYGMPQRIFREFHSGLQGIGSSHDDGLMHQETILVMEQKIVELSSQNEASQARKRRRDIEYADSSNPA